MFNFMHKKILYIEITNNHLKLFLLKRFVKNYHIKKQAIIALDNLEVNRGLIFNPTAIQKHIHKFLNTHTLRKPKTYVSMPELSTKNLYTQRLATLQVSLCIAKAPIQIEALITHTLFNETNKTINIHELSQQKDFLSVFKKYNQNSPISWLTCTAGFLLFFCLALNTISTKLKQNRNTLDQKHKALQPLVKKQEKKVKALHAIQEESKQITQKIIHLREIKDKTNNMAHILTTMAETIPDDTWLTNIDIKPHTKNKHKIIKLTGNTHDTQSPTQFIKKLYQKQLIKNLALKKLIKTSKKVYNFEITGKIA